MPWRDQISRFWEILPKAKYAYFFSCYNLNVRFSFLFFSVSLYNSSSAFSLSSLHCLSVCFRSSVCLLCLWLCSFRQFVLVLCKYNIHTTQRWFLEFLMLQPCSTNGITAGVNKVYYLRPPRELNPEKFYLLGCSKGCRSEWSWPEFESNFLKY